MNKTEQGVQYQRKLTRSLIHILSFLIFCIVHPASAETSAATTQQNNNTQKNHVFIIFSADNTLHSDIIQKLSDDIRLKLPGIIISKVTPEDKIPQLNSSTDLIIAIGAKGMQSANKHYPETNKLFISTDPKKFRLDTNKNKGDAILYMTQSYCRQLQFIKQLNTKWKTISILSSRENPVDSTTIQQCSNRYDIKVIIESTDTEENLTNNIRQALKHSDVLLALPDSNIYNSKSVKNILLTSYRYRKPVIAFSQNFVNAGALASIHSSIEQVSHSASILIQQYFMQDQYFENSVNYPQSFDISINRQVFKALNLSLPDTEKLKQSLLPAEKEESGEQQ